MHEIKFSKKETDYLKAFYVESGHELADPNVVDDVSVLPRGNINSFHKAFHYWFLNRHVNESMRNLIIQLKEGEPAMML